MKPHFPRIFCLDGATVSIQASEYHYSEPRTNVGPYSSVEAGFPSVPPPDSWLPFAEDAEDPCRTVYGWLPVALVNEFITSHGGVDWGKTLDTRLDK